jgi:hypothetical protein
MVFGESMRLCVGPCPLWDSDPCPLWDNNPCPLWLSFRLIGWFVQLVMDWFQSWSYDYPVLLGLGGNAGCVSTS